MHIVTRAIYFTSVKYSDKHRKNMQDVPHINHPIEVCNFLCNIGGITNHVMLCAAILHDILENTKTTYFELVEKFGEDVANIVLECTDNDEFNEEKRKRLQLRHAHDYSDNAKLIKLADEWSTIKTLLENPPNEWTTDRILGYVKWSCKYCMQMYGTNDNIDNALKKLFEQMHIHNVGNEELEMYYQLLKN
jgi:GTP diphosphokinase / guanosine-3',5'-bis(diphosphate) 3'-diphosphatase